MEKKTDLSEEFGGYSNFARREFNTNYTKLDPKTDLSPELNRPSISNSSEFSVTHSSKEFSSASNDPVPPPKPSRLEQHRRSLLLQMASVGLSAVVVTNSLGMDILGDDMLFPASVDEYSREYIGIYEMEEESGHDEDTMLGLTSYVIHSSDRTVVNPGPYENTVRYDKARNTLYLDGCRIDQLEIVDIENELTIFLENTSYIGLLDCTNSNITISGNQGTSLIINQHSDLNWWYGLIMYGEGSDIALTISPDVIVNVRGVDGAIAVDNTEANPGIRFDTSQTFVSGVLQSGVFPFESGAFVEGGSADWTIVDDNGSIATRVIFAPIGLHDENMYDWYYEDENMN